MRRIVHLSDLHFGRVDEQLLAPLITAAWDLQPDLVAISGDLTQRARTREFIAARRFLDQLPRPQLVVPGNHDVPLYNLLARFGMPLAKYRLHITRELQPFYDDQELVVVGVNTARSFTRKNGRVNDEQIAAVSERFCAAPREALRVVVTHHPFDVPLGRPEADIVGRAARAMTAWAACGADVFLAGHLHLSHTSQSAARYRIAGHSAVLIQAGTTTSTRGRGEVNAFNLLRFERSAITVERFEWSLGARSFALADSAHFSRTGAGWTRGTDSPQDPAENTART